MTDAILSQYESVRRQTSRLCAPLSVEDCMVQSMPDVSPPKWHLAHTTWFFETFVLPVLRKDYRVYDPRYGFLFNSYYEAVGARVERQRRGLLSRPALEEVWDYRRAIDALVSEAWHEASPKERERAGPLLILGLHHEQQHQELLVTDIKHIFWSNPVRPSYPTARQERLDRTESVASDSAPKPAWLTYAGGLQRIGHAGDGFCFDNELPRHEALVAAFQLAAAPVTNGEYLEFIEAGGYRRPELWLSDGWLSVQSQGWQAPLYWEKHDGAWWTQTLSGRERVAPDEPVVHVSYYEADAYAQWKGKRLPTEFEWEVAASTQSIAGNFMESGALHPRARASPSPSEDARFWGDVWEWTSSSYDPYPGYRRFEGALGEYNGKFMCNQRVLRGGSCATPRDHIRATYRNFFTPATRWQFSGLRLAA